MCGVSVRRPLRGGVGVQGGRGVRPRLQLQPALRAAGVPAARGQTLLHQPGGPGLASGNHHRIHGLMNNLFLFILYFVGPVRLYEQVRPPGGADRHREAGGPAESSHTAVSVTKVSVPILHCTTGCPARSSGWAGPTWRRPPPSAGSTRASSWAEICGRRGSRGGAAVSRCSPGNASNTLGKNLSNRKETPT